MPPPIHVIEIFPNMLREKGEIRWAQGDGAGELRVSIRSFEVLSSRMFEVHSVALISSD